MKGSPIHRHRHPHPLYRPLYRHSHPKSSVSCYEPRGGWAVKTLGCSPQESLWTARRAPARHPAIQLLKLMNTQASQLPTQLSQPQPAMCDSPTPLPQPSASCDCTALSHMHTSAQTQQQSYTQLNPTCGCPENQSCQQKRGVPGSHGSLSAHTSPRRSGQRCTWAVCPPAGSGARNTMCNVTMLLLAALTRDCG